MNLLSRIQRGSKNGMKPTQTASVQRPYAIVVVMQRDAVA